MTSLLPKPESGEPFLGEKRPWSRPDFNRLETGEAEASDGTGTDSGMIS